MANKVKFSQKHPFIFGFFLISAAVVLIIGAMAAFTFWKGGGGFVFAGPKLGVVKIQGAITGSQRINDWIQRLQRDRDVKGVLVRVDSPGGMVAPSQEIYQALKYLSREKPVVVSMGATAASGGYYLSCAADKIIANPGTITGSIGVKAQLTYIGKLMQKVGVEDETVTSGEFKDAGSPTSPLTPKERAYFQALVDDLHKQFIQDVAQGRSMQVKQVRSLADGRAFTGKQAHKLGLVDHLGGRQTALQHLKKMCQLEGRIPIVSGPEEEFSLLSWILSSTDIKLADEHLSGFKWKFYY